MSALRCAFAPLLGLLWLTSQCLAQEPTLRITQVDKSQFPTVRVFLSLTGPAGRPVIGLKRESVQMTESGKAVNVSELKGLKDEPATAFLVIDQSGSMQGEKIQAAKRAAESFIGLMRPQDRVGLIAFSDDPVVLHPLGSNQAALRGRVRQLKAEGATAFYRAAELCLGKLTDVPGRKSIVVLTDGRDTDVPDRTSKRQAAQIQRDRKVKLIDSAAAYGVPIYAIGLGNDVNRRDLQEIGEETHGAYRFTPSAAELAQLFSGIAKQIQHEMVAVYTSPNPHFDGTKRRTSVLAEVEGHKLAADHTYLVSGVMPLRVRPASDEERQRGSPIIVYLTLMAVFVLLAILPSLKARLTPAGPTKLTVPEAPPHPAPPPSGRIRIVTPSPPSQQPSPTPGEDTQKPAGRIRILPNDEDESEGQ